MAAIPVGAEFAVNTKTEFDQIYPEITRLSNGGFVVAWHDGTGATSVPFDIRIRLFDASGNPVAVGGDANDFIPSVGVAGSQIEPSVASLGENGFVVTWFDEDTSTIYARRFNNNGTAVDAVDRVVQDLTGLLEPRALSVAGKADGSFAVAWSNDGEPDVLLQVFDPTGTGSFLPNPVQANINPVDPNQSRPDIASMGDDFIVTWTSGANADEDDVMGRVFGPDGSALSPTEIPIATGSAEQDLAEVTALPNGGFVTTWYQQETDQIMVGRFKADGTPVGTPLTVNTAQTDSGPVDIAAFGNDYFVVTWTSVTLDVMAQVFVLDDTAGATPLPGQGNFLVGQVDGLQVTPTVTALDGARFAISWSDFRDPAAETDFGIRAQIFKVASDVVAVDDAFSGIEDTNLSIPLADLLANDTNDDGDKLTVTGITYTGTDATVTLKDNGTPGNPSDDFVLIDPADHFAGNLSFTYTVKDEDNIESTANVTVDFAAVNDPPTIDPMGEQDVNEGDILVFSNANGNLIILGDPDSDPGKIQVTLTAADGGLLTLADKTGLTFVPAGPGNDGDSDPSLTFQGTLDDVEAALDGMSLKMPTDFNGSSTLKVEVDDLGNTGIGGAQTATLTIDIVVKAINDPPVATDGKALGDEDTLIAGSLTKFVIDPDGDTPSFTLTGTVPDGFMLDQGGSWSLDATNAAYQSLGAGESKDVVASYTVSDGNGGSDTATLTITVNGVNDAPAATAGSASGDEDTLIAGSLTTLVTDPDGGAPNFTLTGTAPAGFVLNPDGSWSLDAKNAAYQSLGAGESMDVVASFEVSDGEGGTDTAMLTITVDGRNDGPEATDGKASGDEDSTITGSLTTLVTDPEGGAPNFTLTGTAPAGFVLNPDGSWSLDAKNAAYQSLGVGESMDVVVSYTVSDGNGGSDAATLTITVNGVDDGGPVAVDDKASGPEDSVITGLVGDNDSDPDGDTLSFVLNGAAPAGLTFNSDGSWSLDAANAAYQSLGAGDSKDVVASYTVSDGNGGSDSATLTITVNGVNDTPVGVDDNASGAEGTIISGSVATNDSDPDGDTLSFALNGAAPAGLTFNSDGSWSLDATNAAYQSLGAGESMEVVVSYTVSDGNGGSSEATLTVTVDGVSDSAPVAVDDKASGTEDTLISGSVADNDSDPDGDTLSFALNGAAPAGLTFDSDGSWSLDATNAAYQSLGAGDSMDVVAAYTVSDGNGGTDTATLTVTVAGVNDAPISADDLYATSRDTPLTVAIPGLLANDSDVDGDSLTVVLVSGPANGTLTLNPDGSFTYTPAAGYVGADSFTYKTNDGTIDGNTATVRLNVTTGSGGGGNQPAAFTGEVTGGVVEAGTASPGIPTASGDLLVNDPDGLNIVQPIVAGTRSVWGYGTVEMSRDGVWTYTLDNANPTVDRLATGETLTDRFVALAADGTQQVIVITIHGADDGRAIIGTPEPDTLTGTPDDDIIRGLAGRDTLTGGAGDDSIDGGRGLDTALFSGDLAGYRLTRIDERTVEIVDIDPSDGDDGTDILSSIEMLRFGGADPVTIGSLAGQPDWTLERDDVGVTAATYQLFLHGVPAAGGFDYLVMSDVNGADLNDPYYFIFNLENRYLNFASNLGTASPEGAAWFDAEYGALTYEQAVEKAFAAIVSADALRAIGADPAVALDFFRDGQDFFEAVAAERVVRPGVDLAEATKIVMLGSMLYEAVKANVGSYGQAVNDFADIVYASGTHEDLGSSLFAVA